MFINFKSLFFSQNLNIFMRMPNLYIELILITEIWIKVIILLITFFRIFENFYENNKFIHRIKFNVLNINKRNYT